MSRRLAIAAVALLAACQPAADTGAGGSAIARGPAPVFSAIGFGETIRFIGTEPFWSGEVAGGQLRYATPENEAGDTIAVKQFLGNNGMGFSGSLAGLPFDMTVTPGACSDGMSDRSYPYTVTLQLGDEQRSGCAWTANRPFSGAATP